MKTYRPFYSLLFTLCSLIVASCTDEYEYKAPQADNRGIWIEAAQTKSYVFAPDEAQTLQLTVVRRESDYAATYHIECSDDALQLPASIAFAAGEASKTITITATVAVPALRHKAIIKVREADAYTYGNQQIELTISAASQQYNCTKRIWDNNLLEQPCQVYAFGKDNDGNDVYGAVDMLCEGYMLLFALDSDGKATIDYQEAVYDVPFVDGITDKYLQCVEGTGTYDSKTRTVTFKMRYFIDGSSLYTIDTQSITFP